MTKEYRYKEDRNLSNWFHLTAGALFVAFGIYLTIIFIISPPERIWTYGFLVLWFFVSYINIQPPLYRIKYRAINKDLILTVDKQNRTLSLVNEKTGKQSFINRDNVKGIELYTSWNTNPISSDLGYSKIILNDNSAIILTSSLISQWEIKYLFKNKVTKEKSRFMNKIR
jgi:hypothetical protein